MEEQKMFQYNRRWVIFFAGDWYIRRPNPSLEGALDPFWVQNWIGADDKGRWLLLLDFGVSHPHNARRAVSSNENCFEYNCPENERFWHFARNGTLYTFYQYEGYLLFHYLILAMKAIRRHLCLFHGSHKTLLPYII